MRLLQFSIREPRPGGEAHVSTAHVHDGARAAQVLGSHAHMHCHTVSHRGHKCLRPACNADESDSQARMATQRGTLAAKLPRATDVRKDHVCVTNNPGTH